MTLQGRIAVITGAASGIGRATAARLADAGAAVALVDRDAEGLAATASTVTQAGGRAIVLPGDVGAPEAVEAAAAQVRETFGGIDILIAAAGMSVGGTVLTTRPDDWDAVFRANVGGTWLWARAVIPSMQARGGGAIVTFSSQLALAGGRGNSAYVAAKGAILSLTRTMALDFAADNIRVNAIAPGAVETPMLARGFGRQADPDAAREASRQRHALGRFGTADEIAQAALYLASDASSFITGTTLAVDGGWLAS
ncbi:SDR family oxidoreductase [Azorhizobium caulinodans]|jgi:NAD(P)-dependent dehydrogenase (short-subunit alcohol dehydrogenase family)|uniref:SDR family oxidoreductase n=1 Tax=Azorhizobium caulinodans TaxID=7 RepID=UPI002FBF146E